MKCWDISRRWRRSTQFLLEMPSLYELLSEVSKEALVDHILTVGGIYHDNFTIGDGITPKHPGETSRDKFFVVMGINSEDTIMGFLFINSDINQNFGEGFKSLQKKLLKIDYPFLIRDSHLDCSKLRSMRKERFVDAMKRGQCGVLNQNDLDIVASLLTYNHSIKTLRKYNISI